MELQYLRALYNYNVYFLFYDFYPSKYVRIDFNSTNTSYGYIDNKRR